MLKFSFARLFREAFYNFLKRGDTFGAERFKKWILNNEGISLCYLISNYSKKHTIKHTGKKFLNPIDQQNFIIKMVSQHSDLVYVKEACINCYTLFLTEKGLKYVNEHPKLFK